VTSVVHNYAPVAVVAVAILAVALWFAKGKHHFMTREESAHLTIDAEKLLE
jgi:hypothetical protein